MFLCWLLRSSIILWRMWHTKERRMIGIFVCCCHPPLLGVSHPPIVLSMIEVASIKQKLRKVHLFTPDGRGAWIHFLITTRILQLRGQEAGLYKTTHNTTTLSRFKVVNLVLIDHVLGFWETAKITRAYNSFKQHRNILLYHIS